MKFREYGSGGLAHDVPLVGEHNELDGAPWATRDHIDTPDRCPLSIPEKQEMIPTGGPVRELTQRNRRSDKKWGRGNIGRR